MKNFFVSYTSPDRAWAEWIAWQLEAQNYTTVLQAWDFRPGLNFVIEMQRAAADVERTIAVLSPDYLTALYTQPEWAAAFVQDPTSAQRRLIPVVVRRCEPSGMLAPIIHITLVDLPEEEARHELLKGVSQGRVKPTTAPVFPGQHSLSGESGHQKPVFPGATSGLRDEARKMYASLKRLAATGAPEFHRKSDELLAVVSHPLDKREVRLLAVQWDKKVNDGSESIEGATARREADLLLERAVGSTTERLLEPDVTAHGSRRVRTDQDRRVAEAGTMPPATVPSPSQSSSDAHGASSIRSASTWYKLAAPWI